MNLYFQLGQSMPKRVPSAELQEPLGKHLYEALTHRKAGRTRRLDWKKAVIEKAALALELICFLVFRFGAGRVRFVPRQIKTMTKTEHDANEQESELQAIGCRAKEKSRNENRRMKGRGIDELEGACRI
jgi:hypothetical protein